MLLICERRCHTRDMPRPLLAVVLVLLATVASARPTKRPPPQPVAPPVVETPAPPTPAEPKRTRIALPTPSAAAGVAPGVISLAEQLFEQALRTLVGPTVVTSSEVTAILGVERQRALLGGATTEALTSLGDAASDVVLVWLASKTDGLEVVVQRATAGAASPKALTRVVPANAEGLQSVAHAALGELFPEFERTAPVAATTSPQRKVLRVAVLDARLTGDVPARAAAALNQSLTPEVRKLEQVLAISSQEVRDLLGVERQRALVGCNEGTSCMEELANALGAEELITIDLTLVGDTWALTARRIDTLRARVVQSHLKQFARRDGEELLAIVGPMIEALFPDRALRAGLVRGVEPAVIRRLNPPPLPKWLFITTTALALVAGGGGVTFSLLAEDRRRTFDGLAQRSLTMEVAGPQLVALEREGRQLNTLALGSFIAAGGLAAAMLVEGLLTDWNDDRAALAVLPLISPAAAGVMVRF